MVSESFPSDGISEIPNLQSFKWCRILLALMVEAVEQAMGRLATEFKEDHDAGRAAESAEMHFGSDTTSAIRLRLAEVANELRQAAKTPNGVNERLMAIAQKFEQHARAGDK